MCDCITQVDARLKDSNTRLAVSFCLSPDLGAMDMLPIVQTEKIEKQSRKKPTTVVPTYCPFCGSKYERATAPVSLQESGAQHE